MRTLPRLIDVLRPKVRPPLAVALGGPRETAELLFDLGVSPATCYQMDLYHADRLRDELALVGHDVDVVTLPDLWDLPADFQTVLYPPALQGERELKIDIVEQAFHVLRPGGTLIVVSRHAKDSFFPPLLKKIFRKVHATVADRATVFWCTREGDRPRRRHEVTFQCHVADSPSFRFVSRPGVFSYGRFDDGSRALVETMAIDPGERVLDVGCGCGTNGVFASGLCGPTGQVVFVDSNVRAVALAELNARANGLENFRCVASAEVDVGEANFDVALANPPYYAQATIAQLFIDRAGALLKPGGRLHLVTKQPEQIEPLVSAAFGPVMREPRRGYVVLTAEAPAARRVSSARS